MAVRQKLIVDFDGTIVNSVKAYCDIYNDIYNANADWTKVNKWNFEDECPLAKDIVEYMFLSPNFFKCLELFPNAKEVLKELNQYYDVTICTIGTPLNIANKCLWINEELPFIKNVVFVSNKNSSPNKEIVNMKGSIIIDDASKNLRSSNAKYKYCYGEVKSWNEDWTEERLLDWNSVRDRLIPNNTF